MAIFSYPTAPYDRRDTLLALLGSHWSGTYGGRHLVAGYAFARGQEELQAHLTLLETVAALSRFEIPVFHRENWHLLTLRQSELNKTTIAYGTGLVYDGSNDYGDPADTGMYTFPVPEQLVSAACAFNRITDPSYHLTAGIDFTISDGLIRFAANPFDSPLLFQNEVFDGSEIVDREVAIWLYSGEYDWDYVYEQFGYVLGVHLESDENYKLLINAVMDAFVEGSAEVHFDQLVTALTGVSSVRETQETVLVVLNDLYHLNIITDQHVYQFPLGTTALVTIGQIVHAGDQLTDLVKYYDLNRGILPDDLAALTLGVGFLPGDYVGGLTFRNTVVPLQVTYDEAGRTRVSFDVTGFPTDVEAFWDQVHAEGVARGTTLARLLDVRGPTADTEPGPASLPATINPLAFLVSNILRFNTFVVRIRQEALLSGLGLENSRLFRRVLPPWTSVIILVTGSAPVAAVTMSGPGSDTVPGYSENVTAYYVGAHSDEVDGSTYIDESAVPRLADGACQ